MSEKDQEDFKAYEMVRRSGMWNMFDPRAQQASGLITLPLIAISYGQASGSIYGTAKTTIIIGAIAWGIGIASTMRGMSGMKRQRLLGVADGV